MQGPFSGKQPLGVIYNTSMSRPDAALALATLYGFEGKREARVGSVCVVGAGLDTAIFIDMVGKIYRLGPARNSNMVLPVGLAAVDPLPRDSPMIRPAIERKTDAGTSQYAHDVKKFSDTSLAEAVLRNGVIFNREAAVILSAPATYLAKTLDLQGAKDLYKERVKRLVIVDAGAPQQDIPALRRVIAEWPGPVFFCGKEVGESLPYPADGVDKGFEWTPNHPVVDAYHGYKTGSYDVPGYDVAAVHFAVHPDSKFFSVSEPGTLTVGDDGQMTFAPDGKGSVRSLAVDPAQKEAAIQSIVEVASAKPVAPPQRMRPVNADAAGQQPSGAKPDAAKPAAAGATPTATKKDPL